jgi:hypothetical protein
MFLGKKKEAEGGEEEKAEEAGPSLSGMASKKAASRILAAIESGDSAALDSALKSHYEAYHGDE